MATLDELRNKYKHLEGTLVLDHFEVVLFQGIIDGDDDYYYTLVEYGSSKRYLASCVGRITALKGSIPDKEYQYLVSVWNHNNLYHANDPEEEKKASQGTS